MDLGATVCTPRNPICSRCPLAPHCQALETGQAGSIPMSTARRKVIDRDETAVVVRRGAKVLVVRRGAGEWWEGLWDFPRLPAKEILAPLGCGRRRVVGSCSYTVTHHRVAVTVTTCLASRQGPRRDGVAWINGESLGTLAMTAPGRRIAALAEQGEGEAGHEGARSSRRRRG
jgi:A/G-specific adenine glycosylase